MPSRVVEFSVVLGPIAAASFRILLSMYILGPHPGPTESEALGVVSSNWVLIIQAFLTLAKVGERFILKECASSLP